MKKEQNSDNPQNPALRVGAVSERILYLKTRIELLEMRYADICEHSGEWSLAAEKCDRNILRLNDELASLYAR